MGCCPRAFGILNDSNGKSGRRRTSSAECVPAVTLGLLRGCDIQVRDRPAVADTLKIQAEQLRIRRRQQDEGAARKAPIKMLFPLVFLIFPALFVVILAPAILDIM